MQEYSKEMINWFNSCLIIAIVLFVLGMIAAISFLKDKKIDSPWKYILSVAMTSCTLFIAAAFMPNKIEEYTSKVTILPIKDDLLERKKAYFQDGDDIRWVLIEDGQRDMYEMLENEEVLLTYGKVHFFIPNKKIKEDEYRFVDIKLVENQ